MKTFSLWWIWNGYACVLRSYLWYRLHLIKIQDSDQKRIKRIINGSIEYKVPTGQVKTGSILALSFVMSVFLFASARMEQLGSLWKDFIKFYIWVFFENPSRNFNLTRVTDTLHEDHYVLLIIPHSTPLRMTNISYKISRKNQSTFSV